MRPIRLQNITWQKREKVSQKKVRKLLSSTKKDVWVELEITVSEVVL